MSEKINEQDKIYDMLINKDEVTWQTLIMDLIKTEQMNPWDIDLSLLTKRYIDALKLLKEANFYVSGKMILAAALLLKVKSNRLVNEDISNFDALLYPREEEMDLGILDDAPEPNRAFDKPQLTIRTPMARKRKVSVEDLMGALKKALEVNQRRLIRREEDARPNIVIPEKKVDINLLIKDVYSKIIGYFEINNSGNLTFTQLLPSTSKEDKILTFIPLLHLANEERIHIHQNEHFGEIHIGIKEKELKAPVPEGVKVPIPVQPRGEEK